jgi:hypothetical protein
MASYPVPKPTVPIYNQVNYIQAPTQLSTQDIETKLAGKLDYNSAQGLENFSHGANISGQTTLSGICVSNSGVDTIPNFQINSTATLAGTNINIGAGMADQSYNPSVNLDDAVITYQVGAVPNSGRLVVCPVGTTGGLLLNANGIASALYPIDVTDNSSTLATTAFVVSQGGGAGNVSTTTNNTFLNPYIQTFSNGLSSNGSLIIGTPQTGAYKSTLSVGTSNNTLNVNSNIQSTGNISTGASSILQCGSLYATSGTINGSTIATNATLSAYPTLAGTNNFTGTNTLSGLPIVTQPTLSQYASLAGTNNFLGTNTILNSPIVTQATLPSLSGYASITGTNTFTNSNNFNWNSGAILKNSGGLTLARNNTGGSNEVDLICINSTSNVGLSIYSETTSVNVPTLPKLTIYNDGTAAEFTTQVKVPTQTYDPATTYGNEIATQNFVHLATSSLPSGATVPTPVITSNNTLIATTAFVRQYAPVYTLSSLTSTVPMANSPVPITTQKTGNTWLFLPTLLTITLSNVQLIVCIFTFSVAPYSGYPPASTVGPNISLTNTSTLTVYSCLTQFSTTLPATLTLTATTSMPNGTYTLNFASLGTLTI